ncbi:MAG: Flp family type IVb pilin [Acidimicrobiia bacterium]|nr:Flp family type IVb pilin [Acidimicrobiia bacterium]
MDIVAIARYLAMRCRIESERGASLVEYAFLVGLIAIVCLVAVMFLGSSTSTKLSNVGSQVGAAGS